MPPQERRFIPGYQTRIKRALWETVKMLGGPQVPAAIWLALHVFAAFLLMVFGGFRWMLVPGILWVLGHGVMIALTIMDEHWFDVMLAQLVFRYKDRYEA
jgi:type IV secretory pathway TrbD component